MERNNGWKEVDTKPTINSYIYDDGKVRCTIKEPEDMVVPLAMELTSTELDQTHYFFFHMGSKKFLGHLETSQSMRKSKQDRDLSLLVEHLRLFTPTLKIPIIYSIKEIIEAYQ